MTVATFTEYDTCCPMHYPGFVFRELRKQGYGADALLDGTDLSEESFHDPNDKVEFLKLRTFILNAMTATGDIHLGLRLAQKFEVNYIGPPAYAALNAPNLAAGLEVLGRFVHLTFPAIDIRFPAPGVGSNSGEAEISLRPKFPLGDITYFVTGSALLVINHLLKDMLRMPLVASRCEVAIHEPAGWAEVASEVTRVPVRFEAPENRIFFPADLLDHPLPGADPINHQRLIALCEQFSKEAERTLTPVQQVISYLEANNNIAVTLSDAAMVLGYSERGLRRQLERAGTSYRKLTEQCLEKRARELLINTDQPIQVIAHDLGFETPSNFARSFKRWTGMTPSACRSGRGG